RLGAGRPDSDSVYGDLQPALGVWPARTLLLQRLLYELAETGVHCVQRLALLRAHIHVETGLKGNRVYRRTTLDDTHAEGGSRLTRHLQLGELGDCTTHRMDGVRHAERAVAVPTRAAVGDAVPVAPDGR